MKRFLMSTAAAVFFLTPAHAAVFTFNATGPNVALDTDIELTSPDLNTDDPAIFFSTFEIPAGSPTAFTFDGSAFNLLGTGVLVTADNRGTDGEDIADIVFNVVPGQLVDGVGFTSVVLRLSGPGTSFSGDDPLTALSGLSMGVLDFARTPSFGNITSFEVAEVSEVPVPAAFALMPVGMVLMGLARRKRKI